MPTSKKLEKCRDEAYFARVNWVAHFIDIAIPTLNECAKALSDSGQAAPNIFHAAEDARLGRLDDQITEVWGDSISVNFGSRPISGRPAVPVKGRTSILLEKRASLVFSQLISGAIGAMIYPPSSDVLAPISQAYMVSFWENPAKVTKKDIKKLFDLLVVVDSFCSAAVFPNSKGSRVLAKLEAKDAVLKNGGSRIWVWFKYTFRFVRAVLKMKGLGSPT